MTPTPSVVGLWICERVIIEAGTQNPSLGLVASFTGRGFDEFPTPTIPFSVFCFLTDAEGSGRIVIEVTDLATDDEIYRREDQIVFPSRRTIGHVHFRIRDLDFPKPGVYSFDLFVDGEFIAQRRLRVYSTEN